MPDELTPPTAPPLDEDEMSLPTGAKDSPSGIHYILSDGTIVDKLSNKIVGKVDRDDRQDAGALKIGKNGVTISGGLVIGMITAFLGGGGASLMRDQVSQTTEKEHVHFTQEDLDALNDGYSELDAKVAALDAALTIETRRAEAAEATRSAMIVQIAKLEATLTYHLEHEP